MSAAFAAGAAHSLQVTPGRKQANACRHGQAVQGNAAFQLGHLCLEHLIPSQEGTAKVVCFYSQDEEVDYCILKKKPEQDASVVILLLDFKTQV